MSDIGDLVLASATTVGIVLAGAYAAAWMLDLHGVPHPRDRRASTVPDLPAMPSASEWRHEIDRRMQTIERESSETRAAVAQLVESLAQLLPSGGASTVGPTYRVTQQRATA